MIKREIKFRAWAEEMQEMQYDPKMGSMKAMEVVSLNDSIAVYKTLMQYTGMKDRKGVEVYDKDIISGQFINEFGSINEIKGVVSWCEHNHNWAVYPDPDTVGSPHFFLNDNCIVIGNIYQNTDLVYK